MRAPAHWPICMNAQLFTPPWTQAQANLIHLHTQTHPLVSKRWHFARLPPRFVATAKRVSQSACQSRLSSLWSPSQSDTVGNVFHQHWIVAELTLFSPDGGFIHQPYIPSCLLITRGFFRQVSCAVTKISCLRLRGDISHTVGYKGGLGVMARGLGVCSTAQMWKLCCSWGVQQYTLLYQVCVMWHGYKM